MINAEVIKKALTDVALMFPDRKTMLSLDHGYETSRELAAYHGVMDALDKIQDVIEGKHAIRWWPTYQPIDPRKGINELVVEEAEAFEVEKQLRERLVTHA